MRISPLILLLGLVLSIGESLVAQDRSALSEGRLTSGTLSFTGHATVGDFVGRTDSVSGEMTGGVDLTQVRGWVEAPTRTLKTGNGRRDKDLNKSMESDKYPTIRFDLAGVTQKEGKADSLRVTLQGKLLIHGVTRRVDVPATLQFGSSRVRVQSNFPLSLKDYRIGGLSKMLGVLKMYDNIEVHVDVIFGSASRASLSQKSGPAR